MASKGRFRKSRIRCIRKTFYATFEYAETRAAEETQRNSILILAYPCDLRGPHNRHWHIGKEQHYAAEIRALMCVTNRPAH
jgi:hypothetical protein